MTAQEVIAQTLVIVSFGIWAYSKAKRQSIKETIDEIKNIFEGLNG